MLAGDGLGDGQLAEVYTRARAARTQSQVLRAQLRAATQDTAVILQLIRNAWDHAEQLHELWLTTHPHADRLSYSAHARLQARLKSMPVIEQAKGIIMAQSGWPEDRAFDALRRASQRENMKLRDLAAKIVAKTAYSAPGQPRQARPELLRMRARSSLPYDPSGRQGGRRDGSRDDADPGMESGGPASRISGQANALLGAVDGVAQRGRPYELPL